MDLLGWAKRKAVKHEAAQVDTPEEAAAVIAPYLEGTSMDPKIKALLLAVLSTIIAGSAQYLMTAADALAPATLQSAAVVGLTAGLIVLAAKLKTWSGSHIETSIAFVAGGSALGMAAALQKGATPKVALAAGVTGALGAVALLISPSPAERRPDTVKLPLPPGAGPLLAISCILLLPSAARADDQVPPVTITAAAGAELVASSAGNKPAPAVHLEVAGPLALGSAAARGGVFASLDVLGLPGEAEAPSLTDLATWAALRAHGGLSWRVGAIDQAGQHVETRLVAFAGYATRFGSDPAPVTRASRDYAAGLEFVETSGGTRVRIAYGHEDAVSEAFGRGHLLVSGYVPIAGTHGVVLVGAEAALALGHPAGLSPTDRVSVRLLVQRPRSGTSTASPTAPAGLQVPARAPEPSVPQSPWTPELAPGPIDVNR
jgi:hypothetical protein